MAFKIIVNVFYEPGQFLADLLSQDDSYAYFAINGGSSLKQSAAKYSWLHFDDVGDEISSHNHLLNEMTSIYWFWKNFDLNSVDYVGFNHYRRFFDPADLADYKSYDAIVARPIKWSTLNVEDQYALYHNRHDLSYLTGLLEVAGCTETFHDFLKLPELFAPCNMFLMKTELFKLYCEFMFPLLFKLEQHVHVEGRSEYQQRAIAFLSERLTSFWCYGLTQDQKKKVKEVPIQFIT